MKISTAELCVFRGLAAFCLGLADGSEAIVTLAGAHLVSWRTADGVEQLYLSPNSSMTAGQAIRGGVPVIFPQFSTRGPLVRHGFARTSLWLLLATECTPHQAAVSLVLQGEKGSHAGWQHAFSCTLRTTLCSDGVSVELEVSNAGSDTMEFSAALHTYLQVNALRDTTLRGLQGCWYEDANDACQRKLDTDGECQPSGPVDRIYLNTPGALQLSDGQRTLALESTGFTDTVVWNPAKEGNSTISDLPAEAWQEFLCVEAAVIGTPVHLHPGQSWTGKQQLKRLQTRTSP